jgi:hypothetical protein
MVGPLWNFQANGWAVGIGSQPRRVWVDSLRPICGAVLTGTLATLEQLLRATRQIGWALGGRGAWHDKRAGMKDSEGRQCKERFTVQRPLLA